MMINWMNGIFFIQKYNISTLTLPVVCTFAAWFCATIHLHSGTLVLSAIKSLYWKKGSTFRIQRWLMCNKDKEDHCIVHRLQSTFMNWRNNEINIILMNNKKFEGKGIFSFRWQLQWVKWMIEWKSSLSKCCNQMKIFDWLIDDFIVSDSIH